MRNFRLLCIWLITVGVLPAQTPQPIRVTVTGTPADHTVRWNTNTGYCYLLEVSPDLATWEAVSNVTPAPEDSLECRCTSAAPPDRLYYRVHEINYGFVERPMPDEVCIKEGGVVFAFKMAEAPAGTAKICISKRQVTTPASDWTLIGALTDFATLRGVQTVRGPSVWIPNETGDFEVKVEAKNGAGVVCCTVIRQISIIANTPPVISVTGHSISPETYLPNYTIANGRINFTTTTEDPDADLNDRVTRVEYFANGARIGTDFVPDDNNRFGTPSPDENVTYGLVDIQGKHQFTPNKLLLGDAPISARAYDTYGAASDITAATGITITGTVARPTLNFPADGSYLIPQQTSGNPVISPYTVDDQNGFDDVFFVAVKSLFWAPETPEAYFYPNTATHGGNINIFTANEIPGMHTYYVRVHDRPPIHNISFMRTFHVLINSPSLRTAQQMAMHTYSASNPAEPWEGIADPASAPVEPDTIKFIGRYAAAQPYINGNAAGLDAPSYDANGNPVSPAPPRYMDRGVLFTTGQFSFWDDNDVSEETGYSWDGPGDSHLHDRIPGTYNRDASGIEFDVDCQHGQLELELQFGSEEYSQLLGDPAGLSYDAFSITVDGVLISLVPDGTAPISAKTIRPAVLGSQTVWPGDPDLAALRRHLYLDDDGEINAASNSSTQAEYNGMTVRLRLHVFLTPGLHKVRIVIADRDYPAHVEVGQGNRDCGVFIRGNSLRTIAPTP